MLFRFSSAERAVDRAAHSRFIDASARLGLASRGLVHLVIGALAARSALGHNGRALGTRDAVFELGKMGTLPLAFVAIGLCGYGAWRLVQTIADTERKGRSLGGLLTRLGFFLNGVSYFALAPLAAKLAIGMQTERRDPTRETAAFIMGLPGGDWAVAAIGALLIYSAVAQIIEAARAGFAEDFVGSPLSPRMLSLWIQIGRWSIGVRAILFAIMGGFLIRAALEGSPLEARSLGESFAYLREQPYGPYLFGVMSVCILAFAAFSFVYARERRVAPARTL